MNIIIRNVQPEDLDAVTAIEAECFPPAEAAERESISERINAFPESFLVAEYDGRMVGFINGCVTNDLVISDDMFHSTAHHVPSGKTQTVFGLDVIPEYQRRGIAGQLMRRFIQTAREAGRQRVVLTCKENLVHYYEGFGFINDGLSESTHGGAQWFNMTCPF